MRRLLPLGLPIVLAACDWSSSAGPSTQPPPYDAAAPVDATSNAPPDAAADGSPETGTTTEGGVSASFGEGQITSPQGLAIDPTTQNLWVASFGGGVVEFDASRAVVGTFGTSGPGAIQKGVGVAIDSKGNVYVGDYGADRVVELDPGGQFVATFPGADAGVTLGLVTGVALDAQDHLFAVDDTDSLVYAFDASGNVTRSFSTSQSDAGFSPLAGSVGAHFDASGNLWIADYYYHTFVEYSEAGQLLAQYGTYAAAATPGGFDQPYALDVDAQGNIWVTDNANDDVQEFDGAGTFLAKLGTQGTGNGQLAGPTGVVVDAQGRVYVSDSGNNRIVVFTP
jgi:streptogramin lyase